MNEIQKPRFWPYLSPGLQGVEERKPPPAQRPAPLSTTFCHLILLMDAQKTENEGGANCGVDRWRMGIPALFENDATESADLVANAALA